MTRRGVRPAPYYPWARVGRVAPTYGGTVIKSSLSEEAEAEIQKELHGADAS